MIHPDTNLSVLMFFIAGTLMFGYISSIYLKEKKAVFKFFGLGLLFIAVAFAIWSYVVSVRPENLSDITTIGVVPFIAAFGSFLASAASALKAKFRPIIYVIAAILLSTLALLRLFFFDSNPSFSEAGYFYFNAHPVILYAYAVIISFTLLPAVYVIGRQLKNMILRTVMELGFTLVTMGTVILITSYDETLQLINGYGLMIGLLAITLIHTKYRLRSK